MVTLCFLQLVRATQVSKMDRRTVRIRWKSNAGPRLLKLRGEELL